MAKRIQKMATATQRPAPGVLGKSQDQGGLAPFGLVLRVLIPSGSIRESVALFDGRASWSAIEHWRRGRRQAPQWARDIIDAKWRELDALKRNAMAAKGARAGDALRAWHARQRAQKETAGG